MNIYFEKDNGGNNVIIAENGHAKIYNGAPSGIYEGIDLYAKDAEKNLIEHFAVLANRNDLNDYNEIDCHGGEIELDIKELEQHAEYLSLVYSNDKKLVAPENTVTQKNTYKQPKI